MLLEIWTSVPQKTLATQSLPFIVSVAPFVLFAFLAPIRLMPCWWSEGPVAATLFHNPTKKERNDFSDVFGGLIPKRPKRPSRWIFLTHLRIHVQKETAPLQTKPGRPARYPRPSGCQCNLLLTKKPGGSSKNTQPKDLSETWSFSELHKPSL